MHNNLNFSNLIREIKSQIFKKNLKSGVISICTPIPNDDLFINYKYLLNHYSFSALWEEKDNKSFIALDKCKYITFNDSNRFQKAKDFHYEIIKNLINIEKSSHPSSIAKIVYFFSFSDNFNSIIDPLDVPIMEAVLPRILIINDFNKSWIRLNVQFNNEKSIEEISEEFSFIYKELTSKRNYEEEKNVNNISIRQFDEAFNKSRNNLIKNISKGISLINNGIIEKIVLSSKINIKLGSILNLNKILDNLKTNQNNTCIYCWKRNIGDITFGASPEKLFSINKNYLTLEAIAGSAINNSSHDYLLSDTKNLREHDFVVHFLINCLKILKITNFEISDLKVKNFGNISHLHTLIKALPNKVCPFKILEVLHPSPAVCGIPKNKANEWIETLEDFSRGNYAGPIGWIDIKGNADFRVAIRGARNVNNEIQLIAGAGLVRDSVCIDEVEEIKIKFESITKQIFHIKD